MNEIHMLPSTMILIGRNSITSLSGLEPTTSCATGSVDAANHCGHRW